MGNASHSFIFHHFQLTVKSDYRTSVGPSPALRKRSLNRY